MAKSIEKCYLHFVGKDLNSVLQVSRNEVKNISFLNINSIAFVHRIKRDIHNYDTKQCNYFSINRPKSICKGFSGNNTSS